MLGSVHLYELVIQERHLDTFGHVNNAVYLDLFEAARWDLITRNGFGLKEIQERGMGPTILEINLRFTREIKNREPITIKSWLESYSSKVGKMKQQMVNPDGDVCCDAVRVRPVRHQGAPADQADAGVAHRRRHQ
jgi:thioesterase III